MPEEWKPIPGYEGAYEVSDLGQVRSLDRTASNGTRRAGRVLKQHPDRGGYLSLSLCRAGVQQNTYTHRLVLTVFVGEAPEGMEACHNNGDPADNRLENLRWDTHSANMFDQVRHGNHLWASKTECPSGHPYDAVNTGTSDGGRYCRPCQRAYSKAQRVRRPEHVRALAAARARRYRARKAETP